MRFAGEKRICEGCLPCWLLKSGVAGRAGMVIWPASFEPALEVEARASCGSAQLGEVKAQKNMVTTIISSARINILILIDPPSYLTLNEQMTLRLLR